MSDSNADPQVRYQTLTLFFSQVHAAANVAVSVSDNGVPIQFSLGPNQPSVIGVGIKGSANALPLANVIVNGSQILLQTPADRSDAELGFNFQVQIWLMAQPTIETFYLTGLADPNTQISAQVGMTMPQPLGTTQKLFSWYPQ